MKKLSKFLIIICLMFSIKGAAATIYFNKVLKATGTTYTVNTQSLTGLQDILGYSYKIVSAVPGDVTFASGNNENVILYYVNSSGVQISIPGTISRQNKQGSTTQGVNFIVATNNTYTAYTGEAYILALPSFESLFTNGGSASTSSDPIDNVLNAILTSQASKPVINSSVSSVSVLENAGYAVFTFSLSNAPTGSYSFSPTLKNVTATSGTDFTNSIEYLNGSTWQSVSGTLTITSLALSFQLRVPIINFNTSLTDKTFNINTGLITGGGILNNYGSYGVGTILVPVITTSGSLTAFSSCTGLVSSQQNFTVSGVNLVGNLVVTPPAGYEVSTTSGGTFSSSVSLTPVSNSVATTTIYVRLSTTAVNNASGNIVCSSTSAVSKNIATVASSVSPTSVSGSITGSATVCSGTNSTVLTLGSNVGTVTKWQSSTSSDFSTTITDIANTTTSLTASNLTTTTYYRALVTSGVCSSATSVSVAVTVNSTAAPTSSYQIFCGSKTVADLVATGTNLKWYNGASGGSALASTTAIASGTYYVSQTLNSCESVRTSVSVTLNTTPAAPTASAQTFCGSKTVVDLVATGTNLNWYNVSSGGTILATTTAIATGTYYVSQTVGSCESTRTSVSVTSKITTAPNAVTQNFCTSSTVANLVATTTNIVFFRLLAPGPNFKWYIASSGGTALSTSTSIASGTYYVSEILNSCESARTSVAVTVNAIAAPTAAAQNFCASGTVAVLLASGTNVKWYDVASGGTALVTTTAISTQTYYVSQTVNSCESARTSVAVTLNTTPTAAPIADTQTFCGSKTVADLVATGTNLKWYNVVSGGTVLTTSTSISTGTYYVSQTLNGCEGARTSVAVTVNSISVSGSISGTTTVCSGSNSTDLTLNESVGSIQWQSSNALDGTFSNIGGATSATYSATNLAVTTYYRALVTSGVCSAATASAVAITVNASTEGGSISGSATFCSATNTTILILNSYTGAVNKWQSSSVFNFSSNVTDISNTTTSLTVTNLTATTYYRALVTSGVCSSAYSNIGTITVNTLPTVTLGYIDDVSVVATTFSIPFTTSTGSPNKYSITTASNSANSIAMTGFTPVTNATLGSSPIAVTIPASSVAEYGFNLTVTNSATGCYSVYPFQFHVTSINHGVIGSNQIICSDTAAATLTNVTLGSSSGSTTITYTWEKSTTSIDSGYITINGETGISYSPGILTQTTYFKRVAHCLIGGSDVTSDSDPITITVNSTTVPTFNAIAPICSGATLSALPTTSTNSITGTWSPALNNLATTTYTFTPTAGQCATTKTMLITVNSPITPTFTQVAAITQGATLSALPTTSTNSISGTWSPALNNNATTTYTFSPNAGQCTEVATMTITVNATSAPIASAQTLCSGATISDLIATGSNLKWYLNATGGAPLASNIILTTRTYYVSQTSSGTESERTSVSVVVTPTLGSIASISGLVSVCSVVSTSYTIPVVANATNYIWTFPAGIIVTSSLGRTVSVRIDPAFIEGELTVRAFNSCGTTATRTIKVYNKPVISAITGPKSVCGVTTANYSVTPQANTTYEWRVPTGINIISGQGTAAITVEVNSANFIYGVINVLGNSSCGVSNKVYLDVFGVETPTSITGLTQLCNVTSATYSTPAISGATFTWSVPTGITITSGQGTNTINVSVNNSFSNGIVSVAANTSCGTSIKRGIEVNTAKTPGFISGSAVICSGAIVTYDTLGNIINTSGNNLAYSISPVFDAINYTWTLPVGATIVSGQGTTNIIINIDFATFVNGNISVTATTSCSTSKPSALFVRKSGGFIAGLTRLCDITTTSYSVPATIGSQFVWSVPSWMTISSGQNTNSITVSITNFICQEESVGLSFLSNCNSIETLSLAVGCEQFSKINSNQCGTTLANVSTLVSAIVPREAGILSMYKIRIYNGTSYQYIENTTGKFTFTSLANWNYGVTYTVDVALKIGETYKPYGCACNITLPTLPATKVIDTQCGTTLPDLYTVIVANWVDRVSGYKFEVVNGATTRYIETTNRGFSLSSLVGGGTYNTTYTIRVATKYFNLATNQLEWGTYGVPCTMTTPSVPPATKIIDTQCGKVLPTLNTVIVATWISGVSGYRFEVVNGTTTRIIDTPNRGFSLSSLVGRGAYSTTYTIRVATKYGEIMGEYGPSCDVTTPSNPNTAKAIVEKAIVTNEVSVKVYPNPFTTNFKLNFSSSSDSNVEVVVYDMIGRQLERLQLESSEMNNLELGNNYPSGVYNVIVKQGEDVKTLRVIKR